jgi:hypothetical protein
MKKAFISLTFFLSLFITCKAQVEYWGLTQSGDISVGLGFGSIYKTDSAGGTPHIIHIFDSINGSNPDGTLLKTNNEKVIGITYMGGAGENGFGGGTLFEYDLLVDSFKVLVNFNTIACPLDRPITTLTELSSNNIVGTTFYDVFKFNASAQNIFSIYHLPVISTGTTSVLNQLTGKLTLISNGNFYGTTLYNSTNTMSNPYMGSIFSIDTGSNTTTIKYLFNAFDIYSGKNPNGGLIEVNNKLYGTTLNGGANEQGPFNPGRGGVIFEFDISTNSYTKKIDLDTISGSTPFELIKADNNKLYGLTGVGGADDLGNHYGTLIEYDPTTNLLSKKHDFGFHGTTWPYYNTGYGNTGYLLQASNGKLYGTNQYCLFEYDYNSDSLRTCFVFGVDYPGFNPGKSLIEICRKPSYKYFYTDTFTVCVNHAFNYTVHSNNATTYQWNFNGTTIPTQTDSILNFNSIQLADSGTYTCTMQNQCGQTTTMNLAIKVSTCSGIDEQFGIENAIAISPNPAHEEIVLQIQSTNINTIKQVQLKNILGQIILQDVSGNRKINVGHLAKGIYIVEVGTDKGLWVGRFVKY